jgi:hypothetical protein
MVKLIAPKLPALASRHPVPVVREAKLRVIEKIEKICPEIQIHVLQIRGEGGNHDNR